ncbi:T9SS type A sorting domain-containing protein, partial [bacterium]|nr:T9SS type A sorting domain-containing protein [bacterium]MBU1616008.1 T9SS type A sorting domain-containing protein [bacterium]
TLIRSLTPLPAYFGDNLAEWDGYDSSGVMKLDAEYTYRFNAVDEAGNEAREIIGSVIISTIRLEISELSLTPNPFTPDGDGINDRVTVRFKMSLKATPDQLKVLDFYVNESASNRDRRPYALVGLKGYGASGEEVDILSWPDFDPEIDRDPFPNSREIAIDDTFSYLFNPNYAPLYYGPNSITEYLTGTDSDICGDGIVDNDFDALIAFNALNGDPSTGVFYQEFSVSVKDWTPPNGTYIFRTQIELVSAEWVIPLKTDKLACLYRPFHCKPIYHYGTTSNILDGRVEAIEDPVVLPDNTAPVVIATDPGAGAVKGPGVVREFVSATLNDGPKGSGIDFNRSTIALLDPDMIPVAGRQANDAVTTLYWKLAEPLIAGGEYTILVKPVDKANNGSEADPQEFKFRVKDTVAPSVIKWYPSPSPTVNPGFTDDIWVALIDEGGSGLDINNCQISLFKDTATVIAGEISNDNASMLIFSPTSPLTESGTYTIKVVALDKEGNTAFPESTFTISPGIEVAFQGKICLSLPAATKTIDPDTFVVEGVITIDTPAATPAPPEGMNIVGPIISFKTNPPNLKFDKDVTLKMHYTDDELSLKGTTASELKIYKYEGSSWVVVEGGTLYKDDKYLLLNITVGSALANQYALLFTLPQPLNISLKSDGEIYLSLSAGTKRTDIFPATLVKSGMITLSDTSVTTPEPPEEMDIVGPIISFAPANLKFDKDVVLTMHYTDEELVNKETTAKNLKIYKYNGSSWVVADGGGSLNEDNKELTLTIPANSALANNYALFFSKDVVQSIVFNDETVFVYPNPVRGDGPVTFQYSLPNEGQITINVFTLTGTLVFSDKFDDSSGKGRQRPWNLENNKGKSLATGLYIYSIEMDDGSTNKSVIKKLAVIR